MQSVTVICMGKLKEAYLRDACAEYVKRLSGYCKLKVVELTPCRLPDNPSESEIKRALDAEGSKILAELPDSARVFAMCIEGKMLSSEQLSRQMEDCAVQGFAGVAFVIGSSYGLSDSVKKRADFRLSMSPMTFPHQLARVMLLEQIYRSYRISAGGKYHK